MPKIIPFGDRILVKRRPVGKGEGTIVLPDSVQEHKTDIADVMEVPDLSFADEQMLKNAETIINTFVEKAKEGNSGAYSSLKDFREFLQQRTIKVGDTIMIGKYVGTNFYDNRSTEERALIRTEDIIGLVDG